METAIKDISVEAKGNNVHFFKCKPETLPGFEFNNLFISDVHWDSPQCDRELLRKHFEKAKSEGSSIFCFGDFFDLMEGRHDPRRKPTGVREEILKRMRDESKSYIDALIHEARDWLIPYKDNLRFFSYGNHETSVKRNNDLDPLGTLQFMLNNVDGAKISLGQYEGYLKFSAIGQDDLHRFSYVVKYHHGYGGNAKRSKGVLNNQIEGYQWPSADMIVTGHTHHKLMDPDNIREVLGTRGNIKTKRQINLKLGSYKMRNKDGGWEVEKNFHHTALGGWWVDFKYEYDPSNDRQGRNKMDLVPYVSEAF